MKIVAFGAGAGSDFWRFEIPFRWLNKHGHECRTAKIGINDRDLEWADAVILKGVVDKEGIASILAHREVRGLKLIVDLDDAMFVDEHSPFKKKWDILDAEFVIRQTVRAADMVIASTDAIKQIVSPLNKNIKVIKNYYDPDWFDVKIKKNTSSSIRIGWTGSITHISDLEMVAPYLLDVQKKYPQVKYVMCGDPRIKKIIPTVEIYPSVPITMYPHQLAAMQLDIGIAPLLDTEFNRQKSTIKAMEYALCKIPAVCSPVNYSEVPYVTIATDDWVDKLSELIENESERIYLGEQAYRLVQGENISKHVGEWEKILVDCTNAK